MTTRAGRSGNRAGSAGPRPKKRGKGGNWRLARSLDADPEAKRIFETYRPELFTSQSDLPELFGTDRDLAAFRRQGLLLLARAHIKDVDVPNSFDGSLLMHTVRLWKRELPDEEQGAEPLVSDVEALSEVFTAAKRLHLRLVRLAEAMDVPASRIRDSRFNGLWPRERLVALRQEMNDLAEASGDREATEDMRRPGVLSGKPSAREAFFGYDLPMLYQQMFPGRRFTASGKEDAFPSEGVRFACVVAAEVLGHEVVPGTVVTMRRRYRAARRGGQRGPK